MFQSIIQARKYNLMMGTDLRPWEMGAIPEDWLFALNAIWDYMQPSPARQATENLFAKFRQDHPTYRKIR